jgi:predicted lipoprotein with Yx(FWY)xxD motif
VYVIRGTYIGAPDRDWTRRKSNRFADDKRRSHADDCSASASHHESVGHRTRSPKQWSTHDSKQSLRLHRARGDRLTTLAVAACGGSSKTTRTTTGNGAGPASSTGASSATVDVASSGLGTILVNAHGRSLYLFHADMGTKSACSGPCAAAWAPLVTTGQPTAGSGAQGPLLGTSTRSDGTRQVTYNGHPLYLFKIDWLLARAARIAAAER